VSHLSLTHRGVARDLVGLSGKVTTIPTQHHVCSGAGNWIADLGVKGSQVQILSARPKTASDLRKRGSGVVLVLTWILRLVVY
jgi:hypothetical protein